MTAADPGVNVTAHAAERLPREWSEGGELSPPFPRYDPPAPGSAASPGAYITSRMDGQGGRAGSDRSRGPRGRCLAVQTPELCIEDCTLAVQRPEFHTDSEAPCPRSAAPHLSPRPPVPVTTKPEGGGVMTPAQKLYTLPEPVQTRLCALVDAIAGMDALEKFCAHTQITQTARGLLATGDQMSEPAAEVAAITATLLGALAAEATPEHFTEGVV